MGPPSSSKKKKKESALLKVRVGFFSCVCVVWILRHFTVSSCDRELNAHFDSAASLRCHVSVTVHDMSHGVRKPAFCICENKDADQLRGNREADQRLCFRYTDTTIPLLSKSEISSL